MRESRQSSVLSVADKLKYPKCDKKKEHAKESLNFVCLSVNCKARGLICVQCKSGGEHNGHNIQPLRSFLVKLEESLKKIELQRGPKMQEKPTEMVNQRFLLQKLEQQHLEMFSLLKLQVQEISEKIRLCEEEVLKEYSRVREKIFTEFQKETIIGKMLTEVQRYFSEGSQVVQPFDLKFSISKLLALLKIEKQDISVTNQAEMQINAYALAGKTFKNNILVWQRETHNIINDIFKSKPEYQVKEGLTRPTTAVDSSSKPLNLAFSGQFKTYKNNYNRDSVMIVDKDAKTIKGKDDKNGKVVLLNHSVVQSKSGPIRFKVTNQSAASVIQIGVCLKSIISQKFYKFEKTNAAHGLFMASSNNYIYSSGDPHLNNTKGGISFKSGDELIVEVDAKDSKLIVKKKNDNKTVDISLKHISETDWKELYYCVNLGSTGDKVQFLG